MNSSSGTDGRFTYTSQSSSSSTGPSSDDYRPPDMGTIPVPQHPGLFYPNPSPAIPNPSPAMNGYMNNQLGAGLEPSFQPIDPSFAHIQRLNHGFMSLDANLRKLQKHTSDKDQLITAIFQRLEALEADSAASKAQAQTTGNQQTSAEKEDTPTVPAALRAAVQKQAKALVGASVIREAGENSSGMKLILPFPHTVEGFVPRFSPDGH
ncbi:hypothetical protein BJ912DRAFT_1071595, partial [Pholiota molesta]